MRERLTPSPAPFVQSVDCPVEGLLPDSHTRLDSHAVVAHYLGGLTVSCASPKCCRRFPTWR